MPTHNQVHNDIILRESIAKEAFCMDKQGWVDRYGAKPSVPMPGTGVRIKGLTRRSEMNGLVGHVMHCKPDEKGRVTVRVQDSATSPPRDYRVNPALLERTIGKSSSSPILARAADAAQSDVSTTVPAPLRVLGDEAATACELSFLRSRLAVPAHAGLFSHARRRSLSGMKVDHHGTRSLGEVKTRL